VSVWNVPSSNLGQDVDNVATVICGMSVLFGIKIYMWQTGQICLELVLYFKCVKEIVTERYNILEGTAERQFRSRIAS
jgi:hypothetical protein